MLKAQEEIYQLKDLLQIQMLRAYRYDCQMDDLDKSLDHLDHQIKEKLV